MTDYTQEECINEINEDFKKEYGFSMGCDPNPEWTLEKFKRTFLFWHHYKSKLDSATMPKVFGNRKKKKGKNKMDLETRKNITKIAFIDNIIIGLFHIKEHYNYDIHDIVEFIK